MRRPCVTRVAIDVVAADYAGNNRGRQFEAVFYYPEFTGGIPISGQVASILDVERELPPAVGGPAMLITILWLSTRDFDPQPSPEPEPVPYPVETPDPFALIPSNPTADPAAFKPYWDGEMDWQNLSIIAKGTWTLSVKTGSTEVPLDTGSGNANRLWYGTIRHQYQLLKPGIYELKLRGGGKQALARVKILPGSWTGRPPEYAGMSRNSRIRDCETVPTIIEDFGKGAHFWYPNLVEHYIEHGFQILKSHYEEEDPKFLRKYYFACREFLIKYGNRSDHVAIRKSDNTKFIYDKPTKRILLLHSDGGIGQFETRDNLRGFILHQTGVDIGK